MIYLFILLSKTKICKSFRRPFICRASASFPHYTAFVCQWIHAMDRTAVFIMIHLIVCRKLVHPFSEPTIYQSQTVHPCKTLISLDLFDISFLYDKLR